MNRVRGRGETGRPEELPDGDGVEAGCRVALDGRLWRVGPAERPNFRSNAARATRLWK